MYDRCRRCLGLGYRGREDRGRWRIANCPRCGGGGVDPRPETLPENRRPKPIRHFMAPMVAGDVDRCNCWAAWPCSLALSTEPRPVRK